MAEAPTELITPHPLEELVGRLESIEGFASVVAGLQRGYGASLDGVWGSSCALAAAALLRHAPGPLVVVCPHPGDVDDLVDDLAMFAPAVPEQFGAWQQLASERLLREEAIGGRLRLLKQLARGSTPDVIVASLPALLQPVPTAARLARESRRLRRGDLVDLEELLGWLVARGFERLSGVELPGEVALHGGILDVFAPDMLAPVRIELFDNEIDSIRRFDLATQRSLESLEEVDLTAWTPSAEDRGHLADFVPPNTWWLLIEPSELEDEGRHYLQRAERAEDFHTVREVFERAYRFPTVTAEGVSAASGETACHLQIESVERFSGEVSKVQEELDAVGAGQQVRVICQARAEVERLRELFADTALARQGRLHFHVGRLRSGFRLVPAQTTVLTTAELFQRTETVRPSQRRWGRVIDTFLDLREGDFVVHVGHGIARYLGLKLLEKGGHCEEHLELEFQGGTRLYVPATRIELVQKYVGGSKARPTLARLGGRTWTRQKNQAEEAVRDVASEMLQVQASRALRPGIGFPRDSAWQNAFDSSFPYEETADQIQAIADVKADMHRTRPMDRLICGDVGYGKTEVAMRGAFKAIDAGYQVAVLVPTTLLAEQHRRTFSGRMAEFPFRIAALSRFLTRKQQHEVLEGLAEGSIDVVVGTHRLVQCDVQFKNLGLVIIDEEQRFGVEAKERLKTLRQIVDVLTLTATPIPRTLHMSLLGLRDISNLETPPADRLAVETRVTRFSAELIRQAVLRELNRGGQVYFVHNRVYDIETLALRLRQIVPEARIVVGHGQMPEHALEEVMYDFVNHRFDLLLSTTIVESGLDIPNANTIFIDQADTYGLADLHQLRGRVGRYKHRAYCYLLVDPNKALSPTAAKRLRAIEEFSQIGAGFAIAMRDLEIRGAGNILGTEQSGHIAAVGYELYCELLEHEVRRLQNLPPREIVEVHFDLPVEAYLPRTYVPDLRQKIDLYRRLARLTQEQQLDDLASELEDRFGPRPAVVDRLLETMRIRLWAHQWGVSSIHLENDYLVLKSPQPRSLEKLAAASRGSLRLADREAAYLPIKQEVGKTDAILARLKTLLQRS